MGVALAHQASRYALIAAAILAAALLETTTSASGPGGRGPDATPVARRQAATNDRPSAYATPELVSPNQKPGADIHAAWTTTPEEGVPRDGAVCTYDNGAPLDDLGDPASQLSPGELWWYFLAVAADDFELVDTVSPQTNCRITQVRAAFVFFEDGHETATPTNTWQGIWVTIWENDPGSDEPLGDPPDITDPPPANWGLVSQYVPVAQLRNEVRIGACSPRYQIDIPVDIIVAKNTRYWLTLVPQHIAPPQSAWCISEDEGNGFPALTGGDTPPFPPFWTENAGNLHWCPNTPPAGTRRDMAFTITGHEAEPNVGACCNQQTGFCRNVTDYGATCVPPVEVFHPGTTCQFVQCAIVSGACCDDSVPNCANGVNISSCQGTNQRFAPGQTCVQIDPPCGTTATGACCIPGEPCEDLTPTDCAAAGGEWHEELCDEPGFHCPPANDDCAHAILLPSGENMYPFSTLGAATDGPDVSGVGCVNVNQDIWYRYVAPCTGTLAISLCYGTDYDAAMAVYQGCGCDGALGALLACNNDYCGAGGPSQVSLPAITGVCYLIRIGGAGAAAGTGYISLSCTPAGEGACCLPSGECLLLDGADCTTVGGVFKGVGVPCLPLTCLPENNDCIDAFAVGDGLHAFVTVGATTDGPPIPGGHPDCTDVNQDIWFKYTAVCDGKLTVSLCYDTSYDSALAVYEGCGCDPLGDMLECMDDGCGPGGGSGSGTHGPSELTLSVSVGQCYLIRVGGADAAAGAGHLFLGCVLMDEGACCLPDGSCLVTDHDTCTAQAGSWGTGLACTPQTCPPPNDECVDAILIADWSYPFDVRGATTDGPEDSPGGYCTNVHRDVWYQYIASCNGTAVISLCLDTDFDAALAVYSGWDCPPTPLVMVACDNDACTPGGPAQVGVTVTTGQQLLIRVGAAGTAAGTGTLVVGCVMDGRGACCRYEGTCDENTTPANCAGENDIFHDGMPCALVDCPQPTGACCFADGSCQLSMPPECSTAGGIFQGPDTVCEPNTCPQPTGACCFPDGTCQVLTEAGCATATGAWRGPATDCDPNECPQPTGACCFHDGTCQVLTETECTTATGTWQGADTVCDPNTCPQPTGACCFENGGCQVLTQAECAAAVGSYSGHDTVCTPNPCPQPACCHGDLDLDGAVGELDVALFVAAVLNPPAPETLAFCTADVNSDGAVDGLDIQPFVTKVVTTGACPPPAADNCDEAALLVCNSAVTVDNTAATTDPTDPPLSCRFGGPAQGIGTLWFVFQAAEAEARISTCGTVGSASDTEIAVYDGVCGAFTELACNEDAGDTCGRLSEFCVIGLTPSSYYYVQVASFDDAARGPITIELTCPCPPGACCLADGTCQFISGAACAAAAGYYRGDGTACAPSPCPAGACCFENGSCQVLITEACTAAGGTYQGDATTCDPNPCPSGACCHADGACETLTGAACTTAGGYYRGDGTTCEPATCPTGACCFGDGACQVLIAEACTAASGSYQGDATTCSPNPCPPANDDCIAALEIPCNGQATVNNATATIDPADPRFTCRSGGPAQGVGTLWFKFVATATTARVETCASAAPATDTLIAIYGSTGSCPFTEADQIACNDDSCARRSRVCVTGLTPGLTYYVQAASFAESYRGPITVAVTCPCN